MFWDFSDIFLFLNSILCFMPLWSEKDTLYGFQFLKFVKLCFLIQNVIHLGECAMWVWEECVFNCSWKVFYKYQLNPVERLRDDSLQISYACDDFMPVKCINYWKMCVEVSHYNSVVVYFYMQFYRFLSCVFDTLVFRCICIVDCCVFLENLSLYHVIYTLCLMISPILK